MNLPDQETERREPGPSEGNMGPGYWNTIVEVTYSHLLQRLEVSQAAGDDLAVVDQKSKAELSKAKGYIATMKQV